MKRGIVALASLLTLAAGLTACSPTPVAPQAIATARTLDVSAVPFPAHGALFGAWVKPVSFTQEGRIRAVTDYQHRLGRNLDIVNTYRRLHEQIGTESDWSYVDSGATLMISWAGTSSFDILSGSVDNEIRADAQAIRDLRKPILVRLRWEMDRPNLAASVGGPALYRQVWRYVRQIFAEAHVTNVAWVFCPTAEGFAEGRAAEYYPGDDTVDWTCVDVYAAARLVPLGGLLAPFLRWAAQRPKPIIIGEYGISRAWSPSDRAAWLRDATRVFQANRQIKAVVYFESNPDSATEQGEFALSDDDTALTAFTESALAGYFNTR